MRIHSLPLLMKILPLIRISTFPFSFEKINKAKFAFSVSQRSGNSIGGAATGTARRQLKVLVDACQVRKLE